MKKLVMLAFVSVLLLAACNRNQVDEATADTCIEQAKEAVTLLNEERFDEMRGMFDEVMKEELTVEQLRQTADLVKESGTFSSFGKASVVPREGYFITTLAAEYSKDERVYTITFDDQHRLAGLYVK